METESLGSEREQRLDQILTSYLEAVEAGGAPDREALLRRYPEFAAELEAFFANQEEFHQLARPLREVMPSDKAVRPQGAALGLLQEGQIIRDTYEVERFLGDGAFGEVYRVRHHFLGRQAMKVFKIIGMSLKEAEQALGEAVILSRIEHPNIVRVYEANTTETSRGVCSFFTMDYVAGGSLDHFKVSHRTLFMPTTTAVEIVVQVCRGIAAAHSADPPIIHRDIKPQNILVGYGAQGIRVRVSDFGLAKHVNPMTLAATAKGTPSYKPPEAFSRDQGDSAAADVYSLGCTLYYLLTNRLPYPGQPMDLKRFSSPLVPANHLNIQVDKDLEHILARSLALDLGKRYPTAVEMLRDLGSWRPPTWQSCVNAESTIVDPLLVASPMPSSDENIAREMAAQAIGIARQANRLQEAKDLLEEALNKCPDLRERYEYQLRLWHRGIVM